MDEARLSQRERRILAEIEEALSADEALERGLRTMHRERTGSWVPRLRRHRPGDEGAGDHHAGDHRPHRHRAAVIVALLGMLTLALLVLAVATGAPALVWAFAAVWVATLYGLLRLVIRWSRRIRPNPGRPDT